MCDVSHYQDAVVNLSLSLMLLLSLMTPNYALALLKEDRTRLHGGYFWRWVLVPLGRSIIKSAL